MAIEKGLLKNKVFMKLFYTLIIPKCKACVHHDHVFRDSLQDILKNKASFFRHHCILIDGVILPDVLYRRT